MIKKIALLGLLLFGCSSAIPESTQPVVHMSLEEARLVARYDCGVVHQPMYDSAFDCGVGAMQDKPISSLNCRFNANANRKMWYCMIAQGMNYGVELR